MGGGLLQLSIKSNEDEYLTGNPNIQFFKKVYLRYSNFTMSTYEVLCTPLKEIEENMPVNKLSFDTNTKYKIRVPRNGDLMTDIFLKCKLPKIYSNEKNGRIKYVNNLGFTMIKSAAIYIENTLVERVTGEYLYIYHKLHSSQSKNELINEMTGNTHKLFNPMDYDGNYKNSNLDSIKFIEEGTKYLNKYFDSPSSIDETELIVPLTFWFNRDKGLSLPLIALKYHEVHIELELRPLKELIIKEYDDDSLSGSATYYSKPSDLTSINDYIDDNWNINTKLEINYVFLDNKERNFIVKNTQHYLIEQVQMKEISNISGINTVSMKHYHPVKEIIIVPKRSDISNRNEWFNFSNHDYIDINYRDYQDISDRNNLTINEKNELNTIWKYRKYNQIPDINQTNYSFYNSSIINEMRIELDGVERQCFQDEIYYNSKPILTNYEGSYLDNVLLVPFSLHPSQFKPSGFCNLSEINNITFNFRMKNTNMNGELINYNYNINTYFVNYNILHIQNGMGGLIYANK